MAPVAAPAATSAPANGPIQVTVGGKLFTVDLDGSTARVNGKSWSYAVGSATAAAQPSSPTGQGTPVKAELAGKVFKLVAQPGDTVAEGDVLLVLEALKMEMEVRAPMAGNVLEVPFKVGEAVAAGDTLVVLG